MKFTVESAAYSEGYIEISALDEKGNIYTVKGTYDYDHMVIEEGIVWIESEDDDRDITEEEMNLMEYDSDIQSRALEIYQEYIAPDEYDYYLGMSNENY